MWLFFSFFLLRLITDADRAFVQLNDLVFFTIANRQAFSSYMKEDDLGQHRSHDGGIARSTYSDDDTTSELASFVEAMCEAALRLLLHRERRCVGYNSCCWWCYCCCGFCGLTVSYFSHAFIRPTDDEAQQLEWYYLWCPCVNSSEPR